MTAEEFLAALKTGSAIADTDNVVIYSTGGEAIKISASVLKAYLISSVSTTINALENMSYSGGYLTINI